MRISYTANITYALVRLNLKNIRTHSYKSVSARIFFVIVSILHHEIPNFHNVTWDTFRNKSIIQDFVYDDLFIGDLFQMKNCLLVLSLLESTISVIRKSFHTSFLHFWLSSADSLTPANKVVNSSFEDSV